MGKVYRKKSNIAIELDREERRFLLLIYDYIETGEWPGSPGEKTTAFNFLGKIARAIQKLG